MLDHSHQTSSDLFGIIAHVRTRWRLKLALRGAACVLGVAFVLLTLMNGRGLHIDAFGSTDLFYTVVDTLREVPIDTSSPPTL